MKLWTKILVGMLLLFVVGQIVPGCGGDSGGSSTTGGSSSGGGGGGGGAPVVVVPPPPPPPLPAETHPLGLKLLSTQDYQTLPAAAAPAMGVGSLPAELDNSGNMPAVGNQGSQGSCVAWACAYEFKTYQEKVKRGWSISQSDTNHLFSPAYVYNQINAGRSSGTDGGSYFADAINLLQSQGCATLVTMPYNQNDYLTQPSAAAVTEAAQYKAVFDGRVDPTNRTLIKQFLASGSVMPIGITLGGNFYYQQNLINNNYIYKSLGDQIKDMNGNLSYPGHGVTLVGYSDSKSAFKIMNSWGANWGQQGYAWIDYSFFPTACWEVYHFKSMTAAETVSTPNSPSGPTSGNINTSYSYSTGGASSSLGNTVEYQFDWQGDGVTNLSAWGSATQSNTWTSAGTYSVKALARSKNTLVVSTTWSQAFTVIISAAPPVETISTPNPPTGQTPGNVSTSYSYSTVGAFSNLGHSLQYMFDWGDGTYSTWSSSTTASKTWFIAGTYTVKAQARCATDTSIVSAWSSGLSVSMTSGTYAVVAAGGLHTVALGANGTLWAWGDNGFGQLGIGITGGTRNTPQQVPGTTWSAVAAGSGYTIARTVGGTPTLYAWGDNNYGKLGLGDTTNRATPTQIPNTGQDWVIMAAGQDHTLVTKNGNTLWAWGANLYGQLGIGASDGSNHPTPVQIH